MRMLRTVTVLATTLIGGICLGSCGPGRATCEGGPRVDAGAMGVRVVAYNVEFGNRGGPEQVAAALAPLRPDVVLLNELPAGDWAIRMGEALGLGHVHVGEASSADHKDKHRGVVSRTPLENPSQTLLRGRGWNPASVVRVETVIGGQRIALYSLHISGGHGASPDVDDTHAADLFRRVLAAELLPRVIVGGDFNDTLDTPVMRLADAAGYRAAWRDLKLDVASLKTWNAAGPQDEGVIDHIFYRRSPHALATDGGVYTFAPPLADHWPVWAQIRWGVGGEE